MGDVVDITERLKKRKWPTRREREFASRFIRTAELITGVSDPLSGLFENGHISALPRDSQLPACVLLRFVECALGLIGEIGQQINSSPRLSSSDEMKILIAEAMYKELKVIFSNLPDKIDTYKSDEPHF